MSPTKPDLYDIVSGRDVQAARDTRPVKGTGRAARGKKSVKDGRKTARYLGPVNPAYRGLPADYGQPDARGELSSEAEQEARIKQLFVMAQIAAGEVEP